MSVKPRPMPSRTPRSKPRTPKAAGPPDLQEAGADRLMLLAHGKRTLAPDSNALRVLVRLGFGAESEDYTAKYRSAAVAAEPQLPGDCDWLVRAHQLLRRHGQEVCKRSAPRCEVCPLTRLCAWYAGRAGPLRR